MRNRHFLPCLGFAATAALLAGCSGVQPRTAAAAAPAPTAPACLQRDTQARTCDTVGGLLVCRVSVYATTSGVVVYPYTLQVPMGQRAMIVWRLLEPKAEFTQADGPTGLNTAQFGDGQPTNDPNGGGGGASRAPNFRFVFKNDTPGDYAYTVQYRDGNGNLQRCDPTITNQGM